MNSKMFVTTSVAIVLITLMATPVVATIQAGDPCALINESSTCTDTGGCAWCDCYSPGDCGVDGPQCYSVNTGQCCVVYPPSQNPQQAAVVCAKNATCCAGCYGGTCCDGDASACCDGQCYNPDPKLGLSCCQISYPDDLCGAPAVCGPTETCCMGYFSECCPSGTSCCSDYHGNVACCNDPGQMCAEGECS